MSYRVMVEVRCDHMDKAGFQCTNTILFARENSGGLNKHLGSQFARQQGWWTAGGQHFAYADALKAKCPTHKP